MKLIREEGNNIKDGFPEWEASEIKATGKLLGGTEGERCIAMWKTYR